MTQVSGALRNMMIKGVMIVMLALDDLDGSGGSALEILM